MGGGGGLKNIGVVRLNYALSASLSLPNVERTHICASATFNNSDGGSSKQTCSAGCLISNLNILFLRLVQCHSGRECRNLAIWSLRMRAVARERCRKQARQRRQVQDQGPLSIPGESLSPSTVYRTTRQDLHFGEKGRPRMGKRTGELGEEKTPIFYHSWKKFLETGGEW